MLFVIGGLPTSYMFAQNIHLKMKKFGLAIEFLLSCAVSLRVLVSATIVKLRLLFGGLTFFYASSAFTDDTHFKVKKFGLASVLLFCAVSGIFRLLSAKIVKLRLLVGGLCSAWIGKLNFEEKKIFGLIIVFLLSCAVSFVFGLLSATLVKLHLLSLNVQLESAVYTTPILLCSCFILLPILCSTGYLYSMRVNSLKVSLSK